ncbi:hypothetical protein AVEN_13673-1 [Araneus ventricosus]|uniref:Secreted protein n=1 Tax=Araneus ventricosus TaxID=182803 RepID=A0A4Y2MWA5_ARAVE|nr:hypothetical protein AVEN_13673-1 [Araneus ventricosus]
MGVRLFVCFCRAGALYWLTVKTSSLSSYHYITPPASPCLEPFGSFPAWMDGGEFSHTSCPLIAHHTSDGWVLRRARTQGSQSPNLTTSTHDPGSKFDVNLSR